MSLSRRRLLTAIPVTALAAAAGCAGGRPLRVAVVWSGDELRRFLDVVGEYERPVSVYSAGDNIAAVLRGPASDVTPDVAVIPRLGVLHDPEIRGRLRPIPGAGRQPAFWRDLVGDPPLGAWFKIAHKSLVWYRDDPGFRRPESLEEWQLSPGRLSIAAGDGWVLSDWFENVLLARDPGTYGRLFSQGDTRPELWDAPAVSEALRVLGTIWQRGMDRGQGRRALTLQFHDSIVDVFTYRTADLVSAPDFAWPVIARYGKFPAAHFRFPGRAGGERPLVVGGDVAVAMDKGAADADGFVSWLTRRRAGGNDPLETWVREGGFLTPYTAVASSPPILREPAMELVSAGNAHYDLSDRLTGSLAGGDGRGLWRVLTELFSAVVVDREPALTAARTAHDKLIAGSGKGAL
jgi:alpha-glucoside transport system substrate-binding protein